VASTINGYVLWEGNSRIAPHARIVVIATGIAASSSNSKTGGMVQTYILPADVSPVDAVKSGADASICGSCPHRGKGDGSGRTCYVNVGQGPRAVYVAWKRGNYPLIQDYAVFNGRRIRFGTYGDPAAVPFAVWDQLAAVADGVTGYTHQWQDPAFGWLRRYCMASADTWEQSQEARLAGWRTFRVSLPGDIVRGEGEAVCPASAESGRKLTCEQCMACGGTSRGLRGSITIKAHGGFAVMHNIGRRAAAQ